MARFQTFDDPADGAHSAARIAKLRDELARRGLDGFVVPRADEHQSEYVPAYAERLAWLTGFTGSAGTAIVLADKAAIFVDGRYTLQVREQVDTAVVRRRCRSPTRRAEAGSSANLAAGATLGYDPWLHTADGREAAREARPRKAGADARRRSRRNPIDAVWPDRPAPPPAPVVPHPAELAGESDARRSSPASATSSRSAKLDALVVSDPHNRRLDLQHPRRRRRRTRRCRSAMR